MPRDTLVVVPNQSGVNRIVRVGEDHVQQGHLYALSRHERPVATLAKQRLTWRWSHDLERPIDAATVHTDRPSTSTAVTAYLAKSRDTSAWKCSRNPETWCP